MAAATADPAADSGDGERRRRVLADLLHGKLGYAGAPVHDAVAVAALLRPDLMDSQEMYVQIETQGEYCRGMTVGDTRGQLGHAPNARVLTGIDRRGFADLLVEAVSAYDREGT